MMSRICIISDTHDNILSIRRALNLMASNPPSLVVHCGDISSAAALAEFAGLPMRLVFGNCDHDRRSLNREAAKLGFEEIADILRFTQSGSKFFVSHGSDSSILREAVRSGEYDFVLTGHSHERCDMLEGGTRIINPGALYRAAAYSYAELDLRDGSLRFVEVPK